MVHYSMTEDRVNTPIQQHWLDYALSTNERGATIVKRVESFFGDLDGTRWLDIGSGYGGLAISAGRRGARTTGIDRDPKLVALAKENLADQGELPVEFVVADIHDRPALAGYPVWDVITLDNVIEHVKSPMQTFQRLSEILSPDGIVFIAAPNGRSLSQIRSDGHFQLFGISLLDPQRGSDYLAAAMPGTVYDVSWLHRRAVYQGLASMFGLEAVWTNVRLTPGEAERELDDGLRSLRDDFASLLEGVPEPVRPDVRYLVAEILEDCQSALEYSRRLDRAGRVALLGELQREYLDEVWYIGLRRMGSAASLPKPRGALTGMLASQVRRARRLVRGG